MKLNKIFKGLLIAVPVMTLAACSSSSDIDEGAANQSNQGMVEQSTNTDTVEVATISPEQRAEEQLRQKYEALRQEQVIYFDFDKATVEGKYADLLRAHAEFLVQKSSYTDVLSITNGIKKCQYVLYSEKMHPTLKRFESYFMEYAKTVTT